MKRFIFFLFLIFTGCADYYNRTYYPHEVVPLPPFSFELIKTKPEKRNGKIELKVMLNVVNNSTLKQDLTLNRFSLRINQTQEIQRDLTFREHLGIETVTFNPKEQAVVSLSFTIPKENRKARLYLIIDRSKVKGKEKLTLIRFKI